MDCCDRLPPPLANAGGGPTSRVLYPMVGFKGDGNAITLKGCKWVSRPSEPAAAHLASVLEAATLLQHWDRPLLGSGGGHSEGPVLPPSLLSEAFARYQAM